MATSQSEPIKVAVIGYGMSAKIFHIPFILALPTHYTLHSILQRTPTPTNSAATDHPHAVIHSDLSTLLADPVPTLIIITSIPSSHYSIAEAALKAGKNVLCEKPFVPTSAEARSLAALAKQQNLQLAVYQNRRFDADFLTLSSLLRSKQLGRIADLSSHFDRHRPDPSTATGWKTQPTTTHSANGAIYDLGVHLLDQLFVLLGPPKRITGFITNQRIYAADDPAANAGGDSFTVLLHYPDGLVATAKAGVVSAEERQLRFWVRGTAGSWLKEGLDVQEDQLKAGLRPGDAGFGVEGNEMHGRVTSVKADGGIEGRMLEPESPPKTYVEFYSRLAAALRGEGTVPASAEEAAEVLRIIEVAKRSSEEGRTLDF